MGSHKTSEEPILKKILAQRLELAGEIHGLVNRQKEAIRAEDWDLLKAILGEKDFRIQKFDEMEEGLEGFSLEKGRAWGNPVFEEILSEIESILSAISSLEDECRQSILEKRRGVGKTLEDIQRARVGIRRFRPGRMNLPRFVDFRK